MGSTPPAAFAPRPDDDDDVRWALSTALAQWTRGGRADAVVWLRRAGEAADASGAPARATELRKHAATLAETLWSQPPAASDEIDVDIEVGEPDRKAPLPPPPAVVRAAQARLPSMPPLSTHPVDRQSIAELGQEREHFASAPEIVLEEEALDASELEEILDYVGEDDADGLPVAPVSSGRRGPKSFDDRLSSVSEPPLTVEAVLPVRASDPDLLVGEEADLTLDRLSDTESFALRPSEPTPSERPPAVAFVADDEPVEEDFDDRVTMVPHSSEAEAVRAASARSVPPPVGSQGEVRVETREPDSTELLEGDEALAIDADLRDAYRPESIDLGADWAPIESERAGTPSEDRPSAFDGADAFGTVAADVDAADIIDRQTRDGLLADGFETQFGGSEPPRPEMLSELELVPLSTTDLEVIPLSSSDVELAPESRAEPLAASASEVVESLSEADLVPLSSASAAGELASNDADPVLESLPPLEFPSEPPLEAAPTELEVSTEAELEEVLVVEDPSGSGDEALDDTALVVESAVLDESELEAVAADEMRTPVAPSMPEEHWDERAAALGAPASEPPAVEVAAEPEAPLAETVPPPEPLEPAQSKAPAELAGEDAVASVLVEEGPGPATLASRSSAAPAPSQPPASSTVIDGVDLMTARGFEDLPEEVQLHLAGSARVETLAAGEEVGLFGAAIITHGQVDVLPAFADEAGAVAAQSDVIFTRGSLPDSIALRVVAKLDGTRVAVWDPQPLAEAIDACPWVHDELRMIADRFLALCGATLGPLGERLDESLRSAVFQRLEVRTFGPGEELTTEGKPLPGLFVIGGGRVDIVKGGEVREQKSPGEFLFAMAIMSGSKSPATARAGEQGALALFAPRAVAHELMISVPPLLEVLAS